MFLTQVYGTILGGFINYAVMISIVGENRDLLANTDGNSSWSGATMQSYNTNATAWALAKYLYATGATYSMVPIGLAIGFGAVIVHRIFAYVSNLPLSLYVALSLLPYPPYAPNLTFMPCVSTVRPQDPLLLHLRHQHAPVHSVRRLYSL